MAEVSLLDYARLHGLTRDHTKIDPLVHLELLRIPCCEREHLINTDCSDLRSICTSANKKLFRDLKNEPLRVSDESMQYLQQCTRPAKIDTQQVYRDLLPDRMQPQCKKLSLPWLCNGDPAKDAQKIRKAINLEQAVDDLLADLKEEAKAKRQDKSCISDYAADLSSIIQQHATQTLKQSEVLVRRESLQYLHNTTSVSLSPATRNRLLAAHYPHPEPRQPSSTIDLQIDQFSVDVEVIDNDHSPPIEKIAEKLAAVEDGDLLLSIEPDFLSQIDATIDLQLDTALSNVEETQALIDFECESTLDFSDVGTPSSKPTELTVRSSSAPESDTHYATEVTASDGTVELGESRPASKIDLPQLKELTFELPPVNLDEHEKLLQTLIASCKRSPDRVAVEDLPFGILLIHNLLQQTQCVNEAHLDSFHLKSRPLATSESFLWKEPGLRILESVDDDDTYLDIEDFCIERDELENSYVNEQNVLGTTTLTRDSNSSDSAVEHLTSDTSETNAELLHRATSIPPSVTAVEQPDYTINTEDLSTTNHSSSDAILIACKKPQKRSTRRINSQKSLISISTFLQKKASSSVLQGSGICNAIPTRSSMARYLCLKAKAARNPLSSLGKAEELLEDPIESTQARLPPSEHGVRDRTLSPMPSGMNSDFEIENMHAVQDLPGPRSIIVNETLLHSKPLLIRFLEQQGGDKLGLLYRTLDKPRASGPDLVLDARTCLCITSQQALRQRPLPGQKSTTNMSAVHDHIAQLSEQFAHVLVLVHFPMTGGHAQAARNSGELVEFEQFCESLRLPHQEVSAKLIRVPISKQALTANVINAEVWRQIVASGYCPSQAMQDFPIIQDEEENEKLLVEAGLNPLAAQVVSGAAHCTPGSLQNLLVMPSRQRYDLLVHIIGDRAVHRLNTHLSRLGG